MSGSRSFDVSCGPDAVSINISAEQPWFMAFSAGRGKALAPGTYDGSRRVFDDGTSSSMSARGDNYNCAFSEATFTVHAVNLSRANGPLKFWACFVQLCTFPFSSFIGPGVRGEIRVEEVDNATFSTFCR
jgi:hypothetical protein